MNLSDVVTAACSAANKWPKTQLMEIPLMVFYHLLALQQDTNIFTLC